MGELIESPKPLNVSLATAKGVGFEIKNEN